MSDLHFLLWQIESNMIRTLEINKEVEEVFAGCDIRFNDISLLLKALVVNESIRSIRFEGDFLDCLHPESRSELIQTISYLPSLVKFDLGDTPIMVSDLCHLITRSRSLRSLTLHDLVLQGDPEDFNALELGLSHHPSIKEVEMNECAPATIGVDLVHLKMAGKCNKGPSTCPHTSSPLIARKRMHAAKMA